MEGCPFTEATIRKYWQQNKQEQLLTCAEKVRIASTTLETIIIAAGKDNSIKMIQEWSYFWWEENGWSKIDSHCLKGSSKARSTSPYLPGTLRSSSLTFWGPAARKFLFFQLTFDLLLQAMIVKRGSVIKETRSVMLIGSLFWFPFKISLMPWNFRLKWWDALLRREAGKISTTQTPLVLSCSPLHRHSCKEFKLDFAPNI